MKLECVQVCVGYADYLASTLPLNKSLFNKQVVVTSPDDTDTINVCKHWNVEYLATDVMYQDGQKFNKGLAINAGLARLDFDDWVVHMDADIVLPPLTRNILENVPLNEQFLYGIDRVMVPSFEHWQRFMASPLPQHEMAYVYVGPFPVGVRVMKLENDHGGWCPLGYFQLFNRNARFLGQEPFYPPEWASAATSDLYFAYKWPRTHRHLIPEFVCYHLATEDQMTGRMGKNWQGRCTSKFGVKDPYLNNSYRPEITPEEKHGSESGSDVR